MSPRWISHQVPYDDRRHGAGRGKVYDAPPLPAPPDPYAVRLRVRSFAAGRAVLRRVVVAFGFAAAPSPLASPNGFGGLHTMQRRPLLPCWTWRPPQTGHGSGTGRELTVNEQSG